MFALSAPAQSYPLTHEVQVRLFEAHPDLNTVDLLSSFQIVLPENRGFPAGKNKIVATASGVELIAGDRHLIRANQIELTSDTAPIAVIVAGKQRHYAGHLTFSSVSQPQSAGRVLRVIDRVDAHEYVACVVGSETEPGWPCECLKAQAVCTQTILALLKPGESIGDSTNREVYLGDDYVRPGMRACVKSLWGDVLTYKGNPATIFYSSTCGGETANGYDIFGEPARSMKYLQSVKCNYCKDSRFWKDTVTRIDGESFAKAFGSSLPTIDTRDEGGRAVSVTYFPNGVKRQVSGYQFWLLLGQRFGWDKAPGLAFSLSKQNNEIIVRSRGAGHGVGLCNWGARRQALLGRNFKQILTYYFPGCVVTR